MIYGMGVPDLPGKVSPQGGDIGARVQRELLVREAVSMHTDNIRNDTYPEWCTTIFSHHTI